MTVDARLLFPLLQQLLNSSARERSLAADGVCDWIQSYNASEVAVTTQLLMWLAINETDNEAREAQLHALAELAEAGRVSTVVLEQIFDIPSDCLSGSSVEHFAFLRSLTKSA